MKNIFSIILLLVVSMTLAAQTNCYFKPDKERILRNKNLNYFLNNTRDSFKISYEVKDIPGYIREQINCLMDDTLLANPNEAYASGCVIYEGVPRRQLVFHAINSSNFIIVYHHGGFVLSTRALFMRFTNTKLVDVWVGGVDYEIKNTKELVDYIRKQQKAMMDIGYENTYDEREDISF